MHALHHAPPSLIALAALAATARPQTPLYDHRGLAGDSLGQSVATVGDVDGDGFDDYAVGAPHGAGLQPDAGYVALYSAATGTVLWTRPGANTGDLLGWSVSGIGDIDGDGAGDLVAGMPGLDYLGQTDNGGALVLSGATGAYIVGWVSVFGGDQLGFAVAGTGDVDGDGIGDYALGSPFSSAVHPSGGYASITSGATGNTLRFYAPEQSGGLLGYSLDAAGDMNGDGVPDLLAGAPGWSPPGGIGGLNYGKAYVLDGAVDHSAIYSKVGSAPGELLGTSVAGGHDLTGDGLPEAAFGSPGALVGTSPQGRVSVWSSNAGSLALLFDIYGAAPGDELGAAVDLIPDTDGDGVADLLVGVPGADPGLPAVPDAGLAQLHSGASAALLYRINGYQPGDRMGTAVAGLGHVNADGLGDFAAAAPPSDHPVLGADVGWVRTCLGGTPAPIPYCAAKVNSAGCTPRISYTSSASISVGDVFHVVAVNVLENKPGILIWSYQQQALPFYGGTLCVKAPVVRTPVQTSFFNPGWPCTGAYDFHLSHAYMASKGITAGQTPSFQWWSRDSGFAPPNSIGLTDALQVTVLP